MPRGISFLDCRCDFSPVLRLNGYYYLTKREREKKEEKSSAKTQPEQNGFKDFSAGAYIFEYLNK